VRPILVCWTLRVKKRIINNKLKRNLNSNQHINHLMSILYFIIFLNNIIRDYLFVWICGKVYDNDDGGGG